MATFPITISIYNIYDVRVTICDNASTYSK